ncbi:interleukin-1 receptor-associated kinase-like 2 [Rhinophrynus dorsalis]
MEGSRPSNSSPRILDIPAHIMEELCCCLDCLSEWEWMRFASRLISDQTALRRICLLGKTGISVTRELLWCWGQRLPTVWDLADHLQEMKLFRALDILQQWSPLSERVSNAGERNGVKYPTKEPNNRKCIDLPENQVPDSSTAECHVHLLPPPPPPPLDLIQSMQKQPDLGLMSHTQETLSIPQQESSLCPSHSCHIWSLKEVEEATEGFSITRKIHGGEFADVYMGFKADKVYAIKRIKEAESGQQNRVHSYFHTEAQISYRCSHSFLLPLLGFCMEGDCYCLIYRFMKNGSLHDALQTSGSHILSWERRLHIALGILKAVQHLHEAEILHGNIKSANVFLEEDLSPNLGHSGLRYSPNRFSTYTQVKTKEMQGHQAYLPDSVLRSGQLTAHTDIFSCGIVLTEILTGMKAVDKGRNPVYLKDLISEEMEKVRGGLEPNGKLTGQQSAESLCSQQISLKYTDTRAGRLPGKSAFYFASAICLCLTKKRPLLSEVYSMIEKAEHEFRYQQSSPSNVPVESDYDGSSSSDHKERAILDLPSSSSLISQSTESLVKSNRHPMTDKRDVDSNPCECEELSGCILPPKENWHVSEAASPAFHHESTPSRSWDQINEGVSNLQLPGRNTPCEYPDMSYSSEADSNSPSWGILINKRKEKLMEDIALYHEEKLDSATLFDLT